MLYRIVVIALLLTLPVYALSPLQKVDITTLTEISDIVVYGKVESLQNVWRGDLALKRTTDVTIWIEEIYKGEPNLGEDRVIFMHNGGRGVNPETGRDLVLEIPHQPTFEVDERLLLFIFRNTNPDTPKNRRFDYGGLSVGSYLRKRIVEDNEVQIPYTTFKDDGSVKDFDKPITLPLDLVAKIIEAAVEDPKGALEAESSIRLHADTAIKIAPSKFAKPNEEVLKDVEDKVDAIIEEADNEN